MTIPVVPNERSEEGPCPEATAESEAGPEQDPSRSLGMTKECARDDLSRRPNGRFPRSRRSLKRHASGRLAAPHCLPLCFSARAMKRSGREGFEPKWTVRKLAKALFLASPSRTVLSPFSRRMENRSSLPPLS